MNEPYEHIVEFAYYCQKCKHYDIPGYEEPCNECLEHPTNFETKKPVKFESKED